MCATATTGPRRISDNGAWRDGRSPDGQMNLSIASLLEAAANHPLLQGGAIIVGTFILEDAATVLAAMQVQSGGIVWSIAIVSLYLGIVLGDMGLYGLGALAGGSSAVRGLARRLVPEVRQAHGKRWLSTRVFRVVLVSRFIPGARLPTYTTCGFLRVDFRRFVLAAVVATLIWTSLLFLVSLKVGRLLTDHLGVWRWLGAVGFAIVVVVAGRVLARLGENGQ